MKPVFPYHVFEKDLKNRGTMIILVMGLPGTGKSYFSEHLAREMDAVYLNTDIIREKMDYKGQYDEKSRFEVYERLHSEMLMYISNGQPCVVDGTFQQKKFRDMFIKSAQKHNKNLYLVLMEAREGEIKKRLEKSRKHTEADVEVYHNLKDQFDPIGQPHLKIQSDELSLKEMTQKIKDYMYGT